MLLVNPLPVKPSIVRILFVSNGILPKHGCSPINQVPSMFLPSPSYMFLNISLSVLLVVLVDQVLDQLLAPLRKLFESDLLIV